MTWLKTLLAVSSQYSRYSSDILSTHSKVLFPHYNLFLSIPLLWTCPSKMMWRYFESTNWKTPHCCGNRWKLLKDQIIIAYGLKQKEAYNYATPPSKTCKLSQEGMKMALSENSGSSRRRETLTFSEKRPLSCNHFQCKRRHNNLQIYSYNGKTSIACQEEIFIFGGDKIFFVHFAQNEGRLLSVPHTEIVWIFALHSKYQTEFHSLNIFIVWVYQHKVDRSTKGTSRGEKYPITYFVTPRVPDFIDTLAWIRVIRLFELTHLHNPRFQINKTPT